MGGWMWGLNGCVGRSRLCESYGEDGGMSLIRGTESRPADTTRGVA